MTTNLTGVELINPNSKKLVYLYKNILQIASKMPKDAGYRKNLEAIICSRLQIVEEVGDKNKEGIEQRICDGLFENLISQAQAEYILAPKMLIWKPWEPLVERPPRDQWKWPI